MGILKKYFFVLQGAFLLFVFFVPHVSAAPMSVSVSGNGSGTIVSTGCNGANIACGVGGTTCQCDVTPSASVNLIASPAMGSLFGGWSGACPTSSGTACSLTMTASGLSASVNFVSSTFPLSVALAGAGSGTVTSTPGSIKCGSMCSSDFPANTDVTLMATPSGSSSFVIWAGVSCKGGNNQTASCVVTMDSAKTVTANFDIGHRLTVNKSGDGTVTSSPSGINCGTLCSLVFPGANPSVTLTATPASGTSFTGWNNGASSCGTNATCTLTLSVDTAVIATFGATATSCSGKDSSNTTQSGTCSTTSTCSSGTALTSATGCASGMACCYTPSSSTKTTTSSSASTSCTGSNAGIVPCGRSCDNPATTDVDESAICTLCHIFLLMKNITSWIFMVMTYIAFTVLVAMGILYIVSAGNTQLTGVAKGGIKAALYGFAIVLLGWVAINVLLMVLADGALGTDTATFSFKTNGSWFTYSCDAKSKYARSGISGATSGGGTTSGGGGGGTNPGGNGTCDTTTSGPCSVDSLKSTCFGSSAETISRLCNKESKGDPGSKSGVDICTNYSNRAFSGGLFQINVFSNGSQLGDSRCGNLGSKGSCANRRSSDNVCLGWNCQINNLSDFDYCMGLTLSAAPNIKVACSLSNNGSNLTPWACSANKCGLGGTSSNFCK